MGIPVLCRYRRSSQGYYIASSSVHIYSIEELAYLIMKNPYIVDADCMKEELLTWLESEIGMAKTVEELRHILDNRPSCARFAEVLLEDSGYCSDEEIAKVYHELKEFETMSPMQMQKFRADQMLKSRQYATAIATYDSLIHKKEIALETPEFMGSLWHNLATAYARLFLFQTAAECYETAYRYNQSSVTFQAGKQAKLLAENGIPPEEEKQEQQKNFSDENGHFCEEEVSRQMECLEKEYERMVQLPTEHI